MKQFADLHLHVPIEDFGKTKKMIHKASKLGYSMLGIPFPLKAKKEDIINNDTYSLAGSRYIKSDVQVNRKVPRVELGKILNDFFSI